MNTLLPKLENISNCLGAAQLAVDKLLRKIQNNEKIPESYKSEVRVKLTQLQIDIETLGILNI